MHRTLDDRFVAFTYLEIDHVSGEASVIVAGNPAVIIRRDGGRFIEQLDANGMPLGLVEDDEWFAPSPQRITLGARDEILCFTDGLTDTVGRHAQHQFGINRVLAAITETAPRTPLRSLCESIEAFADHSTEQDDLTLLCIGDTRRLAA